MGSKKKTESSRHSKISSLLLISFYSQEPLIYVIDFKNEATMVFLKLQLMALFLTKCTHSKIFTVLTGMFGQNKFNDTIEFFEKFSKTLFDNLKKSQIP